MTLFACSGLYTRLDRNKLQPIQPQTLSLLNGIYTLENEADSTGGYKLHKIWLRITDGSSDEYPEANAFGISVLSTTEIQFVLFNQKQVLDTYILQGKLEEGFFNSKTDRDYYYVGYLSGMYSTDRFQISQLKNHSIVFEHHSSGLILLLGVFPAFGAEGIHTYLFQKVGEL